MIRVEHLCKSFNGHEVFRDLSLEVPSGALLALIGRSGEGKSVLLKHVAGLMKPDRGSVWVDGAELGRLRGRDLEQLRSRLGFLFQSGALFDSLTVFENVAFPLREKTRLAEAEIGDRVRRELDQVGLTGAEEKYPAQISGGMIKRTALARALIREPKIMLFDEPTTGLDPVMANIILRLIAACHERVGFTGIIVSHQIKGMFNIVQKVAMLHEGRIRVTGSPEEIYASQDPLVKQFITGDTDGPMGCGPE